MQDLTEGLIFIEEIIAKLHSGIGVSSAIKGYLHENNSKFSKQVGYFYFCVQNEKSWREKIQIEFSERPIFFTFFEILHEGTRGVPIFEKLQEVEKAIFQLIDSELERKIQSLPFKLMLPTFLFLLPAYLVLLFGPITMKLIGGLK